MQTELTTNIELNIGRLLNRYVSGSNSIKVKDLLNDPNFKLGFRWKSYIEHGESNDDIYNVIIPQKLQDASFLKKIILANPGVGKSTLSYSLYQKIFQNFKNHNTKICPIYLDLAEFVGDPNFGTSLWVSEYLQALSGASNIKWTKTPLLDEAFEVFPFFILDSLDEYLADCTIIQIQQRLNNYIFKEANFFSCRTQFFEFYISSSNKLFVTSFDRIILLEWPDLYHENYTKWYFERFSPNKNVSVPEFLDRLQNSQDLWEFCKVPIRYNMILEILSKNNMNFSLVSKLIRIYHNYCSMTIQHESSRNASNVPIDDKIHCLKKLAWSFYDERKIGESFEKIRFSSDTIKNVLDNDIYIVKKYSKTENLVNDLIKCSVLVEDSNDEYQNSFTSIKFSHKSIQEYFVARHIFETLTHEGSVEELVIIYRSFISQEIDQFFKDYIVKLNTDLNLLQIACRNYIQTYEQNNPIEGDTKEQLLRKRIAKEQIAYNLGHLQTEESYQYLSTLVKIEQDEFIKRSMIIGLSFGGRYTVLDKYVDLLRSNPESEANKINVAMHLSYFGDQSFEILNADVDQNIPKCSNTIKKLIHVINEDKNRGSWRIDLYTILYLSKHRDISVQNCLETITENLSHFSSAINNFSNDSICKNWPEVSEANQLIKKISNHE